jgi:hypothetical protein
MQALRDRLVTRANIIQVRCNQIFTNNPTRINTRKNRLRKLREGMYGLDHFNDEIKNHYFTQFSLHHYVTNI